MFLCLRKKAINNMLEKIKKFSTELQPFYILFSTIVAGLTAYMMIRKFKRR